MMGDDTTRPEKRGHMKVYRARCWSSAARPMLAKIVPEELAVQRKLGSIVGAQSISGSISAKRAIRGDEPSSAASTLP